MSAIIDRVGAALGGLFTSQHRRLLQLETILPSGTLLVERAQWNEDTSGHGHLGVPNSADKRAPHIPLTPLLAVVDCLSTDAHLPLKTLLGEPMSLRLLTAEGRYRTWHGYVTRAAQLGSDGGFARYRLQLAAFTHFLSLRRDSRVFLGQRADDIVTTVLRAYPQANFRFELSPQAIAAAPVRGTTTQYRETDAAFVERLLSEEGWNWRLDHEDSDAPLSSARAARHCLVISDPQAARPDVGPLRLGRPDLRGPLGLAEDTLTALSHEHRVQANAVTLGAWDPRQLAGVSASQQSPLGAKQARLETYDGSGQQRYAQHRDGEDHADSALAEARASLALARHELARRSVQGTGAVRRLRAGAGFELIGPPSSDAARASSQVSQPKRYLVLSLHHEAANNLGAEAAQLLQSTELEAGSYQQHFRAVPADATLVPPEVPKPPIAGLQSAIVVGHPNDTVTTERNLRVKIQFPWQRGRVPLRGGLDGPLTPGQQDTGHAPQDASASQWVRVSQAAAGANWGSVFIPPVGSEVLVDFIGGDIDRPLITGQIHNTQDRPPWPAGVDSGANHPGTISGWHSRNLDGQGFNQWVIDDASGQLRMRLASHSEHSPWSELTLGHVIQQHPISSQRGAWLGSGFLAHTEGWASIRAADGLLLSSTARPGTYGSAEGTQMDAREAVAQLHGANQLAQALGEAASAQGARPLSANALNRVLADIDPAQGGQHPTRKKAQGREETDPIETFAAPHIVLDTPSTALLSSPATIASFSGEDTSLIAQSDIHVAAAHSASFVSGQTTSLYTHEGELQAMAAHGPFSLRGHTDALELLADDSVSVVSVNGEITVTAQRIELIGGDSSLVLDGADITYTTPGGFEVKSASHSWGGGSRGAEVPIPYLPSSLSALQPAEPEKFPKLYSQQIDTSYWTGYDETGKALYQSGYVIRDAQGAVVQRGQTDERGWTERIFTPEKKDLVMYLGEGEWRVFIDLASPVTPTDGEPAEDSST